MNINTPMQTPNNFIPNGSEHVRNIGLDIVLTILTCGLFNIYLQYRQMIAVNIMINEIKYKFIPWFLLCIITCGLYHIYHEWRKSSDIAVALKKTESQEPIINVLLSIFGLSIVADAIQQAEINKYYGSSAL
jgi:hypothetical protein